MYAEDIEDMIGETIEDMGIDDLIEESMCACGDCNCLAIDGKEICEKCLAKYRYIY